MIRVTRQKEPDSFDVRVRQRGITWLQNHGIDLDCPIPAGTKLIEYWRECLPAMRDLYRGFCAYTNILINPGEGTIDHFQPKSKHPRDAYEWKNYRLTLSRINSRKKDFEDVLDPFKIQNGWFTLDFVTGTLYVDPQLPALKQGRILKTIERLQLNDSMYIRYRLKYINDYISGEITLSILKRDAPYIYNEMKRQNLLNKGNN